MVALALVGVAFALVFAGGLRPIQWEALLLVAALVHALDAVPVHDP